MTLPLGPPWARPSMTTRSSLSSAVRLSRCSLRAKRSSQLLLRATETSSAVRGDTWLLTYDKRSCRLRDAKGLHYLAALLARSGQEVHVFDLVGSGISGGGTIEALDAKAKADYRRRLSELESDEAEAAIWETRAGRIERARGTGSYGRARRRLRPGWAATDAVLIRPSEPAKP